MSPLSDGCTCDGCTLLRAELQDSPHLRHYGKKLLIRGWAGDMSPAERAYARAHAPFMESLARRGFSKPPHTDAPNSSTATHPDSPAAAPVCVEPVAA